VLFDLLDADSSGYLEFSWNSSDLKSDVGRRLLKEMCVDPDNFQETYQAMKALDANGDGRIDRQEFIRWMAERSLELA
jgi:Ca2+-binding EF-hand superfamily protein